MAYSQALLDRVLTLEYMNIRCAYCCGRDAHQRIVGTHIRKTPFGDSAISLRVFA